MEDSVGQAIQAVFDPMVNRHSGNIILIVGSSECGKSSILAKVLLPIFSNSNGFITTFMSPSYDSLPIQELVLNNLSEKRKTKKAEKNPGNPTGFKLSDLYKTKEWLFTRRGFDADYCHKIYNTRLKLYKNYGEADKVREFRFVLALDDEIDIGGSLIRKVCLTWRNKGISWIQLVQDITNLDCAVRNSAPIVFFGHMNFPARRRQICEEYLSPYIPGGDIFEKMDFYSRLTSEKRFILMNHRLRKAFHLDTHTGVVTELPELSTAADMEKGFYELQQALPIESKKEDGKKKKESGNKYSTSSNSALPVSGSKRKSSSSSSSSGAIGGVTQAPHQARHAAVDDKKRKKKKQRKIH